MGLSFSSESHPALTLHTAATPSHFPIRSPENPNTIEESSLESFLRSYCPSLYKDFRPPWWLKAALVQDCVFSYGHSDKEVDLVYDRKFLRLIDGGTIGLDFAPPAARRTLRDDTPIVVVSPGITGGTDSWYINELLKVIITPKEAGGLGYRGAVVNFRGCAGVSVTSAQFYSAGHTDDLRQALVYISKTYPDAPVLGVGFCLGANVLVRYLGEEGERSRLRSACVFSCPWDVTACGERLDSSSWIPFLYSRWMADSVISIVKKHVAALSNAQDDSRRPRLTNLLSKLFPRILDVDESLSRVAGGGSPPFPFATVQEFRAWASSDKLLSAVRVPLLAINAADDPVVRNLPRDVRGNGLVVLAVTSRGGHIGWHESWSRASGWKVWSTPVLRDWLGAAGERMVMSMPSLQWEEVDGWIREVGRDHLGFREVIEDHIY